MHDPHQPESADDFAQHYPLLPSDPVRVGDFWLDARLTASQAGTAFTAHEDGGDTVMLLLLSEGAAADHAARARFSGEINAMHIDTVVARGGQGQDEGRLGVRFRDEDDDPSLDRLAPLAPWVALAFTGTMEAAAEASRVLHAVDLAMTPQLSQPKGPDYELHWANETQHGVTRLWPLPWPGRTDRASWITFLVSWLLMLLVAALAILLAILLFQNAPQDSPPPPIQQESSGEGGEGGESGEESADASPTDSASPDPGDGPQSESLTPSMREPEGDDTGPGEPSPNRRL